MPDWGAFGPACDAHDFRYWLGGDELDRRLDDYLFYQAMGDEVRKARWWKRGWLRLAAILYYGVVKRGGALVFPYGPYKTREQLAAAVAEARQGGGL